VYRNLVVRCTRQSSITTQVLPPQHQPHQWWGAAVSYSTISIRATININPLQWLRS